MLVLSRKLGERIVINDDIEVVVLDTRGERVRLGIVAPPEVSIHREEVRHRIQGENRRPLIRRHEARTRSKAS